jgi:hypothetical protein
VHQLGRGDADERQQRFQQAGKRRFADPAQAQRGQRDAELAGRQIGIQLAVDFAEDAPLDSLCLGDGARAFFAV